MLEQQRIQLQCKALGNDRWIAIVQWLKGSKHATVSDIARAINRSMPVTSQHLAQLERTGILKRMRRGNAVLYRLSTAQEDPAKTVLRML